MDQSPAVRRLDESQAVPSGMEDLEDRELLLVLDLDDLEMGLMPQELVGSYFMG